MPTCTRSATVRVTSSFTLIEILIAITILGLALGATLTVTGNAQMDMLRARERWLDQHAMEQATEYYLLTNPNALQIPEGFLPEGYDSRCTVVPVSDGLPEHAIDANAGWVLGAYTIEVFNPDGTPVGHHVIYKLIPDEI